MQSILIALCFSAIYHYCIFCLWFIFAFKKLEISPYSQYCRENGVRGERTSQYDCIGSILMSTWHFASQRPTALPTRVIPTAFPTQEAAKQQEEWYPQPRWVVAEGKPGKAVFLASDLTECVVSAYYRWLLYFWMLPFSNIPQLKWRLLIYMLEQMMSDHAACVLDEEWVMHAMMGFGRSPSILKKCLALRWWISVHPSTTIMSHK